MGRPLSWLDRLHHIRHTVEASPRSHYDRKALQKLFNIQARSAQKLMTLMPVVPVGLAHLVEKDALAAFLRAMNESEDPGKTILLLRSQGAKPPQRKLRQLTLEDVSSDLDAPPEGLTLLPGEMTIRFQNVEQLATAMLYLAVVLEGRLDDFATRYEPVAEPTHDDQKQEALIRGDVEYIQNWKPNK